MRVHLALIHVTAARLEEVFDRIFQRDDVVLARGIHLIDHGSQCGRLSGTDGTSHEDKAVVILRERLERLRQIQLIHGADLRVDDPEGHVETEAVAHDTGTETAQLRSVGKVDITDLLKTSELFLPEETLHETIRISSSERLGIVPDGREVTMAAPVRLAIHS